MDEPVNEKRKSAYTTMYCLKETRDKLKADVTEARFKMRDHVKPEAINYDTLILMYRAIAKEMPWANRLKVLKNVSL